MAGRRATKPVSDYHRHGCKRCHRRYDDVCDHRGTNELCGPCRGVRPWQLIEEGMAPRDHCRNNSRLADKEEIRTYKLAGEAMWFICRTCKRTFPYHDPGDPASFYAPKEEA